MPAWLGDGTAAAAARILAALRNGEPRRIHSELDRATEICRMATRDPAAAERNEVLEAVIRELRDVNPQGQETGLEAHTCLLTHLAGL